MVCSIIGKLPQSLNFFSKDYPNILAVKDSPRGQQLCCTFSNSSCLFPIKGPSTTWTIHFLNPRTLSCPSETTTSVTTLHQHNAQPPACVLNYSPSVDSLVLGQSLSQSIRFLLAPLPSFPDESPMVITFQQIYHTWNSHAHRPSLHSSGKMLCGSYYSFSLSSHCHDPP